MSTPIFDALYAESDDATRALVWAAVRPVSTDIGEFIVHMNRFARAFASVAAIRVPLPEITVTHVVPHKTSAEVRTEGLLGGLGGLGGVA